MTTILYLCLCFLIQLYGFWNIWSGFITAWMDGVVCFMIICFGLTVICESGLCRHISNLSSSHWFPAWKIDISHQTKKCVSGDNGDCHMMMDDLRSFHFPADLKWLDANCWIRLSRKILCVHSDSSVSSFKENCSVLFLFCSYKESLWFDSVVLVVILDFADCGKMAKGMSWQGILERLHVLTEFISFISLFLPLLHVSTRIRDCDIFLLFDSVARLDFNHYVWEERS